MDKNDQEQPTRVKPRGGATRCPYCHDACDPATEVVVCRECLSRHHEGCWSEGGEACSSSSAIEALTPEREEEARSEPRTFEGPAPLAILLAVEAGFFYGVFRMIIPAFKKMFEETGINLPAITKFALTCGYYPLLSALVITGLVSFAARFKVREGTSVKARLLVLNALLMTFVVFSMFLPLAELLSRL